MYADARNRVNITSGYRILLDACNARVYVAGFFFIDGCVFSTVDGFFLARQSEKVVL